MKKLMLVVVMTMGFVLVGFAYGPGWGGFGHGPGWGGFGNGPGWGGFGNPEFDSLREIMQYGNHNAKKLDNGIWISLLSNNEDLAVKIKGFFAEDTEDLKKYFNNTAVKVSEVATGVEITLTSDSKEIVDKLHYFGQALVYNYLRDRTFRKINNGEYPQDGFQGQGGYVPGRNPRFGYWQGCPFGY